MQPYRFQTVVNRDPAHNLVSVHGANVSLTNHVSLCRQLTVPPLAVKRILLTPASNSPSGTVDLILVKGTPMVGCTKFWIQILANLEPSLPTETSTSHFYAVCKLPSFRRASAAEMVFMRREGVVRALASSNNLVSLHAAASYFVKCYETLRPVLQQVLAAVGMVLPAAG